MTADARALDFFPPQLSQLVLAGASDLELEREGHSWFDISAVRALTGRARDQNDVRVGEARRRLAGSNPRPHY
jgi:hypothetical protein